MTVRAWQAIALDAVLIIVFAAVGRLNHGESLGGTAGTAWPFLVGAAIGWLAVQLGSHRSAVAIGPGITVWLCTVAGGIVLRAITDEGTAVTFVAVAALVLALLLLGWRIVVALLGRRGHGA